MILDSVKSFEKYRTLVPGFDKVYDFIRKNNLNELEEGRHEIDGNRIYCTIAAGELKGIELKDCPLEIHDSYIDIHFLIDGSETIGLKDRCLCDDSATKYDSDNDIAFLPDAPDNYVSLGTGNFIVVFPSDAHAPLMGEGQYRKAVFKVRLEVPQEKLFE